jgi:hypothetical protein
MEYLIPVVLLVVFGAVWFAICWSTRNQPAFCKGH